MSGTALVAILAALAVAHVFRSIVKAINDGDTATPDDHTSPDDHA